jgi:uncharacterized protein YbaP (TraB family)
MLGRLLPALLASLLAAPAWPQTEAPAAGAAPLADTILVVGQRPGPGLWKISKGEHVLWVFGTYSPLPRNMEWRSQQVESILAQSQEYLTPPTASANVGFFRSLTLLPHAIGFKKNPDGAQLKDLLPDDVYARWQLLKQKYIGENEGIERERPIFVADELFRKGLEQAGLSAGYDVRKAIEKIVKKNKIKTTVSDVELAVDDPAQLLKDFKKSPLDDVACFAKTLDRLETDIEAMRVRANAWAKGDLETIQKLSYADRELACQSAVTNSAFFKQQPGLRSMEERLQDAWVATAEKSLGANASSFAILPLRDILAPNGLVAVLRAKGYQVEAPE